MPIMVGALFSMLQGYPALSWLTVGFPLAASCATLWTWHSIRSTITEVIIADDRVATLSLFEAADPVSSFQWKWAIDLRVAPDHAELTLGLSTIRLHRRDWPEWTPLLEALHSAYQLQSESIRPA
jgi:hypothetical protein